MIEQQTQFTPGTDDELNWLAFQYVTEQLPENQRTAFETVLADDLAACEAVAAMSELAIQLKLAASLETDPLTSTLLTTPSFSSRLGSWVAVSSTLVALGWLFILLNGNDSERQSQISTTESQEAAGLIASWTVDTPEIDVTEENLSELETIDLNDSSTPDIPGWLIAAVSLENSEDKMTTDLMDEPVEMKEN